PPNRGAASAMDHPQRSRRGNDRIAHALPPLVVFWRRGRGSKFMVSDSSVIGAAGMALIVAGCAAGAGASAAVLVAAVIAAGAWLTRSQGPAPAVEDRVVALPARPPETPPATTLAPTTLTPATPAPATPPQTTPADR